MTQKDKYYQLLDQYVHGKLSSQERHELEKKALDDPFFFDALEGWSNAGNIDHSLHISRLKNKIKNKSQSSIVRRILWPVAIAASLLLIFSIGNILTQNDDQPLATFTSEENDEIANPGLSYENQSIEETPASGNTKAEEKPSITSINDDSESSPLKTKERSSKKYNDNLSESVATVSQDEVSERINKADNPPIPINSEKPVIEEEAGSDIASAREEIKKPSTGIDPDQLKRQPLSGMRELKNNSNIQNSMVFQNEIEIIDEDLDDFIRKDLFMKGLNPIAKKINSFDITFDENLVVTEVKLVSDKSALSDSIIEIIKKYNAWKKKTITPNSTCRYNYPSRIN